MIRSAIIVCTILIFGLIVVDFFPLGVMGEWTWPRIPYQEGHLLSLLISGVFAGIVFLYLRIVSGRISSSNFQMQAIWLVGLTSFGVIAPFFLCQAAPGVFGIQRTPLIIYYPMTSGYFLEAKRHPESVADYLQKYPEELKNGDFLHLGTHPPGLIILYRCLNQMCQNSPFLCRLLKTLEPVEVTQAFDFLGEQTAHLNQPANIPTASHKSLLPLQELDRRVIWLRILLGALLVSTLIPAVYFILMQETSKLHAWWFAGSCIFLPGMITFFPKSDTLYPAFSVLIVLFSYMGLKANSSLVLVKSTCFFIVGLILAWSLCFSLALLPIGVVIGFWIIVDSLYLSRNSQGQLVTPLLYLLPHFILKHLFPLALGFSTFVLGIWYMFHLNLLEVWQLNLQNHARFYDHNERHYLAWLFMNLGELTLTLGFPLIIPMVLNFRNLIQLNNSPPQSLLLSGFAISTLTVWGLLWLSGKNMGEAMRLWIFWSPLFVILSANAIHQLIKQTTEKQQSSLLSALILCQIIICLATASRIDGFGFTNFSP